MFWQMLETICSFFFRVEALSMRPIFQLFIVMSLAFYVSGSIMLSYDVSSLDLFLGRNN